MGLAKETALALPRLALLVPRVAGDERVPTRIKLALGGLVVYLASPWDIIPDFIPVLGQIDDLGALLLFVDGVLNQVDDEILLEHWAGDPRTLRFLQWSARQACRWAPKRLKEALFGRAVEAGRKRMPETVAARD